MHPQLLDPDRVLPGAEDLPCSDDTPVDNENQNTLPNWLLAVLEEIWDERQDWFFGVDMGIYDREAQAKGSPLMIPDGFLSLGVQRHQRQGLGRLSYVLQEEEQIVPIFALEFVSKTYGQEYDDKLDKYRQLGVQYYVIYNREYSSRDQHQPFEVYRLGQQGYRLQQGEPYWMPEIGLGIGRVQGKRGGTEREWLAWHDQAGNPYPLPAQLIKAERQRADQEQQARLREQQRADQEQQARLREQQRADQEQQARLQEQQRTEQLEQALRREQQRVEQAELEKLQLLEKLRQLGIEPDQV